jgi:hypothetical protein
MVKLTHIIKLLITASFGAAQLITSGHYLIQDFQGRCFDFVETSTNDFVPVFTMPCVTGSQTQIVRLSFWIADSFMLIIIVKWDIVEDAIHAPVYFITTTTSSVSVISTPNTTSGNIGLQLTLRVTPLQMSRIVVGSPSGDATHWTSVCRQLTCFAPKLISFRCRFLSPDGGLFTSGPALSNISVPVPVSCIHLPPLTYPL